MKTLLTVFSALLLIAVIGFMVAFAGLALAGAGHADFNGLPLTGAPRVLAAALGLFIATIALVFALVMAGLAIAGALLAVFAALVLTGLILLAVAIPLLLPLLIPLTILLVLILAFRRSPRQQTA